MNLLLILGAGLLIASVIVGWISKGGKFIQWDSDIYTHRRTAENSEVNILGMVGTLLGLWFVSSVVILLFVIHPAICFSIVGVGILITSIVLILTIKFSPQNPISLKWDKWKEELKANKENKDKNKVDIPA